MAGPGQMRVRVHSVPKDVTILHDCRTTVHCLVTQDATSVDTGALPRIRLAVLFHRIFEAVSLL